jgi:hypothetical protein
MKELYANDDIDPEEKEIPDHESVGIGYKSVEYRELRRCKRCFKEFHDNENIAYSPARDLGDIFISGIGDVDVEDLCPECREELGVMNIIGFRP